MLCSSNYLFCMIFGNETDILTIEQLVRVHYKEVHIMCKKVGGRVPQFKVDEEKGVVVAYITNCMFDAVNAICTRTELSYVCVNHATVCSAFMNNTYRGKAKLMPGDTFSVEEGKRIAVERLKKKYDTAKRKALTRFLARWKRILLNESESE